VYASYPPHAIPAHHIMVIRNFPRVSHIPVFMALKKPFSFSDVLDHADPLLPVVAAFGAFFPENNL
jgi:hypothetical protein